MRLWPSYSTDQRDGRWVARDGLGRRPSGRRRRRLIATGAIGTLIFSMMTTIGVASAPAYADTVIDGCTIVSQPTAKNFTDCPGEDLSLANLSGIDLAFANLSGANLGGSNLGSATLHRANLANANLSAVFVGGRYYEFTNLTGADLGRADLVGADLNGADRPVAVSIAPR